MSRSAVSCELFVNAAHLDEVSFPSKPSSSLRETAEKPLEPRRDVQRPSLRFFEDAVVVAALLADLSGHAIETLRAPLRPRQRHVRDRARNSAVAVVERMNRHEPEMRERRFQHRFGGLVAVEPVEKAAHFPIQSRRWRRLEVDALEVNRARHDLHRRSAIATPTADGDAMRSASARGKE